MIKRSSLQWGIFELENATCKKSGRDVFGQKLLRTIKRLLNEPFT